MSTQSTLTDAQEAAFSAVNGACINSPCCTFDAIQGQVGVATVWDGWFRVARSQANPNGVDLAALQTAVNELVALGLVRTGVVGGVTYYGRAIPGQTCSLIS